MGTFDPLERSDESFNQSVGATVVVLSVIGFLASVGAWWSLQSSADTSQNASYGSGWAQHPLAVGFFLMLAFGVVALSTKKHMPTEFVVALAGVNLIVVIATCFTSHSSALVQFGAASSSGTTYSAFPAVGLVLCVLAEIGLLVVAVRSAVWK